MKEKPKISCIMTTFNSEEFLKESIENVLNQSFNDFEFIISDGGSSDKTIEILKNFQKKDSRIIILENSSRKGIAECLNDCIKISRSDVIAIMESDDISFVDRFSSEYETLQDDNYNFVITSRICGKNIKEYDNVINYDNKKFLNQFYCFCNPALVACGMFKKSLFEAVGEFESYTWDIKFFFDCVFSEQAKIKILDSILYFKRDNGNGASKNKKNFHKSVKRNRLQAIKKYKLPIRFYIKVYYDYYTKVQIIPSIICLTKRLHMYKYISPIWRNFLKLIVKK